MKVEKNMTASTLSVQKDVEKETFASTLDVNLLVEDVFDDASISGLRLSEGRTLDAYRAALKISDPMERDACLMRCAERMWSMEGSQSQLMALKIASKISDRKKRDEWYADLALQVGILGDEELAYSILERVSANSHSDYVSFVRKNLEKS